MGNRHLTREMLRAVSRGVLPARVVTQIGRDHPLHLCPVCHQELQAFQEENRAGRRQGSGLLALSAVVGKHASDLGASVRRAEKDLAELRPLSMEKRRVKVQRARARFRGRVFVMRLLAESQRRITSSPAEAYEWAELARLAAQFSPHPFGAFDLLALATAYQANACRVGDDTRKAEQLFTHARHLLVHGGVTDLEISARIDDLEGSLRMDQRRFQEAEELLSRSAMLYNLAGSREDTAKALIMLGDTFFRSGQLVRAIETTQAALQELPAEAEPRLYVYGRYHLARFLTEAGQWEEAADLLAADEAVFRRFPEPWIQLRIIWLRGKIAAGRGDAAAAERAFLEVRDGFIAQGNAYDAAMVSLEDIAILYLQQGRTADVRRFADEILPIFQAQGLHQDALAALVLFQEAARQDGLTVARVRDSIAALRDAELRGSRAT